MKIDRKFRKTLSEIPNDCKQLIEKLKNCTDNDQFLNEICSIKSWNIGKCELYHWADVLDKCNSILESACAKTSSDSAHTSWQLACDLPENSKLKALLLAVLQFTALLIEHSYSRHLYNSIEHLTTLLESTDFHVILAVLNLLYVFSKRSIFINRLSNDKKQALLQRLLYLAESWGGKENGLDLVKCCCYTDLSSFPASATAVNFEYIVDSSSVQNQTSDNLLSTSSTQSPAAATSFPPVTTPKSSVTKHVRLEKVHLIHENPAVIMERVLKEHDIPEDKRVLLYTYIRLAHSFPNYEKRKLFVQARLQSLSILVYSGAIQEHANNLLYDGLIEELVDVLTVKDSPSTSTTTPTTSTASTTPPINQTIPPFPEIKAASLKTLTAIIHLEKTNKLTEIIDTTQAASYHGLLPTLVRKCVDHLIDPTKEPFPHQFATSLFSFLYHLATYDTGGDALVKCGIMETLLKVVNHNHNSQEFIMFVTRAVRVIDLITNLDMTSFEVHNGLNAFINRLEYEVNECRKEQPFEIKLKSSVNNTSNNTSTIEGENSSEAPATTTAQMETTTEEPQQPQTSASENEMNLDMEADLDTEAMLHSSKTGLTCYHQRSALLKSILNFFKKAIADSSNNNVPNLGDSIRHMMEGSLPNSLKHIISNADYYGPSLFLLATDVVQLFIFQEPSQLSQLQENGLTDVILFALLKKNIPATREVLGSLPTVFSALCLNTNGLNAFIESKPFDKLFQVLLSPDYLPAMRRRRNADQVNGTNINGSSSSSSGTASQLGSAMDELMRHQPSLRIEAMNSIIKLLNQLIEMGKNPNYICQRQSSSSSSSKSCNTSSRSAQPTTDMSAQARTSRTTEPTATQIQNQTDVNTNENQTASTSVQQQQSGSDDENQMEDYDSAQMMIDNNTENCVSNLAAANRTSKLAPKPAQPAQPQQLECIPLLDYITNIMKFIEAILSNNSTDDHCKEFVKQKGLVPLLQILSLPNLPIDFPNSAACQSVAQVCKAILHLARESQVIDQALSSLADALNKCESLYNSYVSSKASSSVPNGQPAFIDGSVLIRELAQSDNPVEAINCPSQTPFLHSVCSVHSFIYLLITLGKINQNDVRNLTTSKWGSDMGVKVLKDLCKLYMNIIWESSMLLWLCNEEQQQQQLQQLIQLQQIQQQQLAQMQDLLGVAANNHLSQIIQQLSSGGLTNFDFNKADLEKIRKNLLNSTQVPVIPVVQPVATQTETSDNQTEKMDTVTESVVTEKPAVPAAIPFQPYISYSKLLRPLFNCSSKLGRSQCELFGLLVKLSAGSWKNTNTRRNMMPHLHSSNATPTQAAINVATALSDISIASLSNQRFSNLPPPTDNLSANLHPKFRLTFYICSIGFTSSILFDEQKRPYHLMLQRFDQLGGVKALFDAFYWSLSLLNNTNPTSSNAPGTSSSTQQTGNLNEYCSAVINQDRDRLLEGTLEFIESWLSLIQKLVNTKNMLETRHSLNPNPAGSSSSGYNNILNNPTLSSDVKKVCSFDPVKFLFKIQKESFQALMCLWDNKSFIIRENYLLSETVLNILCQILVGDSQLQKKMVEQSASQQLQSSSSSGLTGQRPGITTNPRVDPRPQFIQAIENLPLSHDIVASVGSGTNPPLTITNLLGSTSNVDQSQSNMAASSAVPARQLSPVDQENISQIVAMGFSAELAQEAILRYTSDSLEQAIEYCVNHPSYSAGANQSSSVPTSSAETPASSESTTENPTEQSEDKKAQDNVETIHQLDQTILDRFANTMLPGLMKILDNVPDTVYRVCDLIVVVVRKYGEKWRDNCLSFILEETCDLIKQVYMIYSQKQQEEQTEKLETDDKVENPVDFIANAFVEQKLASRLLLFCLLFEEMQLPCSRIVNSSNLLDKLVSMLQIVTINSKSQQSNSTTAPVTNTPVWLTSVFILIDLIEKAALATKRKAAINEQFKNHQRVWKWYEERQNKWIAYAYANNKIIDNAYKNGDTSVRLMASRKPYIIHFNTMLQENEETLHKRPVMLSFEKPSETEMTNSSGQSPSSRPSSPLPTEIVTGLQPAQTSVVIQACVELISWPVSDSDCLHAILRLILRLTRQQQYAIEFASRHGPQHLLNLTQRNSFIGYASLITLIFRHICEDEKNLRLTMEKAIRLALTGAQINIAGLQPGGIGSRELHNVLRLLGPAICRHPDIFCEVACDILRILIRREDEAQILNTTNINTLQQLINQPLQSNTAYCLRAVQAKLMPPTPMPDYARELVIDLLNYLIKPSNNVAPTTTAKATTEQKSPLNEASSSKSKTPTTSASTSSNQQQQQQQVQPLISKSGVLRILSELVRSYAGCAKIVTQHVYKASDFINQCLNSNSQNAVPIYTEDCNALAFLLDNLLASNQTFGDKDCPSLCRLLIVALASCNHCLDSQNALVQEVKLALNRAINLPESNDKHIKIQAFASIINTMIETCPSIQNPSAQQNQQNGLRNQSQMNTNQVNNMMKIMHKKGLINDLARVPLHVDLSCSKCIETLNTILKPLETMTKTLNISARKRDLIFNHKAAQSGGNVPAITAPTLSQPSSVQATSQIQPETQTSSVINTGDSNEVNSATNATIRLDTESATQQHSGVTSDVAGLNLAADNNIVLADAIGTVVENNTTDANLSRGNDDQMVDLNMTEMEPQQTLPQDVDMLPTTTHHHHHRRELDERVFDRVIEALNQEDSDSDSEYESQNRIIRIEADNEGDQIHIQIETGDDDDDDDDDDDEDDDDGDSDDDEDATVGISGAGHDGLNNRSSGDDEDDHESVDDDDRVVNDLSDVVYENVSGEARRQDDDEDDDDDDDDDDDEDDEDEHEDDDEDDDENIIDEEIVEGSDGRSPIESDLSDDENNQNRHHQNQVDNQAAVNEQNAVDTTGVAANGGVVTTNVDGTLAGGPVASNVGGGSRRRRGHRHRIDEADHVEGDEDEDDEDDDDDEDNDDHDEEAMEDMELEEDENEMDDENEIIEDDEADEDDDENEDEEDEDEDENDEDEDDAASEYYDTYNQMLDFINDDTNENEEEDFLTQIENLWQNHASSGHIVLGHQLGIGSTNNRNYQINFLGGPNAAISGLGASVDGTLPPHPLSVSAVHPLLVHSSDIGTGSSLGSTNVSSSGASNTAGGIQISGLGIGTGQTNGGFSGLGNSFSPILRTMRQNFQIQPQQGQSIQVAGRSSRTSAAGTSTTPSTSAQSSRLLPQLATAQPGQAPVLRSSALPYNTLNEILQGFETPAAALHPSQPSAIIATPSATSFFDLIANNQVMGSLQNNHAHHATTGHHFGGTTTNNAITNSNTLANLNNQDFLVNLNSYNNDGFGENIGNGATNLYIIRTPLARWNEECTVLDSHSMHHAILLNKPKIMEALEKYRNEELNEKREKKLKEEKERQKRQQTASLQTVNAPSTSVSNERSQTTENESSTSTPAVETNVQIEEVQPQQLESAPTSESATVQNMEAEENTAPAVPIITEVTEPENPPPASSADEPIVTETSTENQAIAQQTETSAATAAPAETTLTTPAEREAATNFLLNFVATTCSVFTIATSDERRIAIEALRMAEHPRASLELQAATANESIEYPQNYVFLDGHVVEIPTGIDPSFLSALPDQLRREVIIEQLRIQGIDIRNRPIPPGASTSNAPAAAEPVQANTQQATAAATSAASNSIEINPEFLAALPPQIQEELLTQQRIEQQARAAAAAATTAAQTAAGTSNEAGTSAPAATTSATADDDNTAFMRALPSSLRQAILFDMDHSQISALPEDLATEARSLQQQHRDREMDFFEAAAAHRSSGRSGGGSGNPYITNRYTISTTRGLGGIYNVASSLLHDNYGYGGGHGRDLNRLRRGLRQLNDADFIFNSGGGGFGSSGAGPSGLSGAANLAALEKSRTGRQLLDHESIACLLVLLFIDDPRMNMTKLHRVVRNLCIHSPTRAWVIKALLCILEKVSGKPDSYASTLSNQLSIQSSETSETINPNSKQTPGRTLTRQTSKSPGTSGLSNNTPQVCAPSWLTMSIDGAFGSKTNVFTIIKPPHKKSISQSKLTPENQFASTNSNYNPSISINLQACPAILKQILEILSTLARAANFNFFPRDPFGTQSNSESTSAKGSHHHGSKSQFWDIIVKLDQSKHKFGKQTQQPGASTAAQNEFDSDLDFTIENSPLARLMSMLDYPVLKNNPQLMDKMFTCLSYASSGIPTSVDPSSSRSSNLTIGGTRQNEQAATEENAAQQGTAKNPIGRLIDPNEAVLNRQIELVVNVLKNKLCTQDGLQQAYTLLNNLSRINGATRNMIIKHLLRGTRELGLAVCNEIDTLMEEVSKYNQTLAITGAATPAADENMEQAATQNTPLLGSYTSSSSSSRQTNNLASQQNLIDSYSNLVISSPKTKQTRELQLPSMSMLVEKNSNQKFFVRLIRLIINLRETIEKEAKKKKNQLNQQATASSTTTTTATGLAAAVPSTTTAAATGSAPTSEATATTQENTEINQEDAAKADTTSKDAQQLLPLARLSSELDLDLLWNKLSSCLTVLKSLSDPYAVLILQQTVEAFFYVHATRKDKDETKKREKETKEAQLSHLDTESSPMSPGAPTTSQQTDIAAIISSISSETSPDTKRFLEFALTHRTVLNHILRQTSNNLSEEPYSVLVEFTRIHTHILDFDVKRRYFRQELDKLKDSIRGDDLAVHVRRTNVFDDSYRELNRRSVDDWKHRFYIVFEGEEGQDAGGLLREWYMIISKEIFNPDYALFMINPGDRVTYMPNPSSHFNPNHLSYFKFIGHIIAKAIFDNKFLDCYFTRAFYKHILGVPVKYTDMESVDNEFYKNLVSILESDIDTFGVDLFFSIDINEFGVTQSRDLKPNGRNLKVTNENKIEYVRLVCQEKMIGSIRQQVSAFLQGFYEIIPKSLISIFNEQELELLISGLPEIDLEDLRRNTEYHKYTSNSLQIQWFWRALKSFDKEDQAKFLQFVTGTSKVPLQGFSKLEGMNGPQKFQIHRDDRDTSRLPCAHTCFNQLDLPAYENYEKLRNMLLMAFRECSTGFGLA